MEETNKKEKYGMCDCGNGMHWHRGMTRRMVLVIIVVIIAFWCGLKLGEIKGSMASNYGYAPMHQRGVLLYQTGNHDMMPMQQRTQAMPAAPVSSAQ